SSTAKNAVLGNAVTGADSFVIEGYKAYTATSISASDVETITSGTNGATSITPSGTWYGEAKDFLEGSTHKTDMQSRIGSAATLRAGIEVNNPNGDLTVNVNEAASGAGKNPQDRGWDLSGWRFGGQPGVLTLRASGNLIINGSISDGFLKPP